MTTLVKHAIIFFLTISANSMDNSTSSDENNNLVEIQAFRNPKEQAFQILDNKCNICHKQRNKRRVFTPENMNTWAKDIYTQVYIKKRMPKGKKIKLTSDEYQDLLTWISSPKTNQNGSKL